MALIQPIIPPVMTQTDSWRDPLPSLKGFRRALLVLTVASGILSVIPPLRLVGMLALRSVSLLSTLTTSTDLERPKDLVSCAIRSAKIGVVVLGLVAVATATPLFVTISLIADMVLQGADAIRAASSGHYAKMGVHIGMIAFDALALAAVITGSWELMIVAASLSILAMLVVGVTLYIQCIKRVSVNFDVLIIDSFCYIALAGVGGMSLFAVIDSVKLLPNTYAHYKYTNDRSSPILIETRPDGKMVRLEPGETYEDRVNLGPGGRIEFYEQLIRGRSEYWLARHPIETWEVGEAYPSYQVYMNLAAGPALQTELTKTQGSHLQGIHPITSKTPAKYIDFNMGKRMELLLSNGIPEDLANIILEYTVEPSHFPEGVPCVHRQSGILQTMTAIFLSVVTFGLWNYLQTVRFWNAVNREQVERKTRVRTEAFKTMESALRWGADLAPIKRLDLFALVATGRTALLSFFAAQIHKEAGKEDPILKHFFEDNCIEKCKIVCREYPEQVKNLEVGSKAYLEQLFKYNTAARLLNVTQQV